MDKKDNELLDLLADLLDKFIDSQKSTISTISNVESTMSNMENSLKGIADQIEVIYGKFQNGFRQELKDHITESMMPVVKTQENMKKTLEEIQVKNSSISRVLHQPSYWLKIIAGIIVALGSITTATISIIYYSNHPITNSTPTSQNSQGGK